MAHYNGLDYSDNDLLDLELAYSRSLVRDQKVLDLINYVRDLHTELRHETNATEDLRIVADKINEEIEGLEEHLENKGVADKAVLYKKDVKALRKLSDELNEKVTELEGHA